MRTHTSRQRTFVLKILILLFALNASISSSACCANMGATTDAHQSNTLESNLPCHSEPDAKTNDTQSDKNECCHACITMALVEVQPSLVQAIAINAPIQATMTLSSGIDPPFRPPTV